MEGYVHRTVYVAPADGERSSRGWLRVQACTQGAGKVAPSGGAAPVKGVWAARLGARGARSRGSTPIGRLGMEARAFT